jgi:nucleotidyltransferase/DNA polymerase involved in DNA repair
MMRDSEIELLAEEVGRLGIGSGRSGVPNRIRTEQENEEIVQLGVEIPARRPLANAQTVPTRQPPISLPSSKPPNTTTIPRAKPPPQPSNLPPFHHRNYLPNTRPRVVYTTTSAEADDLLSCLRGPVLGFDLEWPVSGKYRTVGADGRAVEQRVGMKWTANGWGYEQARTALVQFCDERLVVLVHLRDMEGAPSSS